MKIIATDIYKKFRQEWVFKSLNYTFESGNSYAIVGQNGAGKSTLVDQLISQPHASLRNNPGLHGIRALVDLEDSILNGQHVPVYLVNS